MVRANYANTKVYILSSKRLGLKIIGATTQALKERLKVVRPVVSANYGKSADYKIELVEHYPCESLIESNVRVKYWQKVLNITDRRFSARKSTSKDIVCPCGLPIQISHLYKHKTTIMHRKRMATL